jgi:hypothetical protein
MTQIMRIFADDIEIRGLVRRKRLRYALPQW